MKKALDLILYPLRLLRKIFRVLVSPNRRFVYSFRPGHFYSPLPDINEINQNSQKIFDKSVKDIPGININEESQVALAKDFITYYGSIPFSSNKTDNARYYFENSYYSFGDGIVLYSMMRHFKPHQIIEVGSGFTSAEMLDINDMFFDKKIDFTFIDPYPARLFSLLSTKDKERCTIIDKLVQDVSIDTFQKLGENDILFIDSSHVAKIHSDLLHIIFKILPTLKSGVIIHFHDILWPFEYPKTWLEEGRAWNEAYFIRSFLQYNDSFKLLYSNSFMETHHGDFLKENMPLTLTRPLEDLHMGNTSLWIRKVA